MRSKLMRKVRKANTWAFTALAIILSVMLATGLNLFFSWAAHTGIRPITWFFATLDAILIPLILAPFMLNLFKRAANMEEINQQLQQEIAERQCAQQAAQQRAAQLQAINNLALECTAASPDVDLPRLIADRLRELMGAKAVSISTYDPQARELKIHYVAVDGGVLSVFNGILGRSIIGITNPVSSEFLKDMLARGIYSTTDLSEITFGAIPKPIATAVRTAFGENNFTGISLCYRGELWGTTVIASQAGQPPLDTDLVRTFANIAAVSMYRQNAEFALRRREDQMQAIMTNLPLIFFVVDADGIFTVLEGKGLLKLGLQPGQLVGQSVFQLYQEYPKIVDTMQQVLAGQINHSIHIIGEIIYEIYYTPLVDNAGQPAGAIGVAVDVTDERRSELERDLMIAELEAKNSELERFTYTVSHDLKSPLITIRGFLGFLEKDALSGQYDRMKSDINRIVDATDRMQRLLNELLELSRIGRLMNPPEETPFASIVADALRLVEGRLLQARIRTVILPNLPSIYGDRMRLVEVMQNLLDNACKFMGDQALPCIEIGVRNGQPHPIFFVRDNGVGIDPQYHQKIFGLFDKLDPQSDGTGIGLALVKRIIEVHHGEIWVESDGVGHGTTFCFTLPDGKPV